MPTEGSRSLSSLAGAAVQYAVIISFVFTVIAFGVNWVLFAGWGLSYAVAAAPSDALIGALEAAGIFLPHFVLGSSAFFAGRKLSKAVPNVKPIALLLLAIVGILISFIAPEGVIFEAAEISVISLTGSVYYDFMIIFPVFVFLATASGVDRVRWLVWPAILASLSIMIILSLVSGYQNRAGNLIVFGDEERCVGTEYVVWVGTSQLVTSCRKPPFTEQNGYFVIPKEGIELQVLPKSRRP